MQFADSGSPPPTLYYYAPAAGGTDTNTFHVSVQLQNHGASFVKGGIFVSGYDPGLVRFDGVNIAAQSGGDCIVDLVTGGFLSGILQCNGNTVNWDPNGGWGTQIRNPQALASLLGFTGALPTWLASAGLGISVAPDGKVSFSISAANFDLDYWNVGRALMVVLSGIDMTHYYGQEYLLHGNTPDYPGGENGFVDFLGHVQNWPSNLDHTTQTILVTNCYGYATYAAPDVCIDPNPYSQDRKVCIPQDVIFSQSNGAPVAVTRVEEEPTPYNVFFTIHFQNVNAGKVLDLGYIQRCSPYYPGTLDTRHLNAIRIWDVRIGKDRLTCTPADQIIRLDDTSGAGQITCTYPMTYATARSAYKTPLIIEAWYGYMDTMQRQVYIKRAG